MNLFSKSLDTKPSIDFLKMARRNVPGKFIDTTKEPRIVFELLSADSNKSKIDRPLHFTNFISTRTNHNILFRLEEIFRDLRVLQSKEITSVDLRDRIIQILNLYNFQPSGDQVETDVVKVDVKGVLGVQDGVRVFLTFDHQMVEDEYIIFSKIILVDLYHLVIPSHFQGRTPERAKVHSFNQNLGNNICISNYLRDSMII
jgi:hypothetical protein